MSAAWPLARRPERCVLVLQGGRASWTLWRGGHCVAERVVPIEALGRPPASVTARDGSERGVRASGPGGPDTAASGAASPDVGGAGTADADPPPTSAGAPTAVAIDDRYGCPWPAADGGERLVDVVVDSPLDEIEQVYLSAAGGGESSGGDRHAPPADAPATVEVASRTFVPGTPAPPAAVPGRLRRAALRARLARRHPEATVLMAPPAAAPLVAALLRATVPPEWAVRLEALQRGPVTIRALRSALRLRVADGATPDGDVLEVTRGVDIERHILYRVGCPAFTRALERYADADADADDGGRAERETLAHLAARHGVAAPRVRRREAPDDARRLARLALSAPRERALAATRPALLEKCRHRAELRRLRISTTLTALIAGGTVLAAAVHGLDSARQRARALSAAEALERRVGALDASLAERHPAPALAAGSLDLLAAREARRPPAPGVLLGALAALLDAHPDVRLERLAWRVGPTGGEDGEWSDRVPDAVPDAPSGIGTTDPDEIVLEPVSVELAGRIGQGDARRDAAAARPSLPLGERQRRFEAFVDALAARPGTGAPRVRLSPAGAASRDESSGSPTLDFELRFRRSGTGGRGRRRGGSPRRAGPRRPVRRPGDDGADEHRRTGPSTGRPAR